MHRTGSAHTCDDDEPLELVSSGATVTVASSVHEFGAAPNTDSSTGASSGAAAARARAFSVKLVEGCYGAPLPPLHALYAIFTLLDSFAWLESFSHILLLLLLVSFHSYIYRSYFFICSLAKLDL